MSPCNLDNLEGRLAYTFNDRACLLEALSHSSFINEQTAPDGRDNERLEFLGDAVLNLVVGHLLMLHFPDVHEGNLSRMRAAMVNESQLADVARRISLGPCLRLGKGEIQTEGHNKQSILADALEALIAAVYLDGGFAAVFALIRKHFASLLADINASHVFEDYKSRLQELIQETNQSSPVYTVMKARGPDHDKTFIVQLAVSGITTEGTGKSKKAAEQDAACNALALLETQG
jgi:ribonuclease III